MPEPLPKGLLKLTLLSRSSCCEGVRSLWSFLCASAAVCSQLTHASAGSSTEPDTEVWKRSGAWFYKGIPKYILPLKISNKTSELHLRHTQFEPQTQDVKTFVTNRTYTWAKGRVATSDSESDSELSSSSLDEKVSFNSRDEKYRKNRIDSVSSTETNPTSASNQKKPFVGTLSSGLSGSLSSLGSDRVGAGSASESYPGEFIEGYDSDISRRGPGKHHGNLRR
ncbi:hypothetical protein GDO81_005728 [Engystomops pustulosus]|uniref:Uncharacterized protein n=1 Tax=Engystomops pustulosus TaxID=76066 RepID=A0AAV7CS16_ENGPU|nr:hypothetical protein GDO81_005728 [Engystomops pustulosus]